MNQEEYDNRIEEMAKDAVELHIENDEDLFESVRHRVEGTSMVSHRDPALAALKHFHNEPDEHFVNETTDVTRAIFVLAGSVVEEDVFQTAQELKEDKEAGAV